MFTGIIEELGTVQRLEARPSGARVRIGCRKIQEDLKAGDSIAVNGVCLTAVKFGAEYFEAEIAPETLKRTNLGALRTGSSANLERPLSPAGRLGGHIVQGHIDATAEFVSLEEVGAENWWLNIRVPPEIERYVVFKGSIAIDGISLTVANLDGDLVSAAILPFTFRNTTLQQYRSGDRVNVECDILAKYVERMLGAYTSGTRAQSRLSLEKLQELGY